MSYLQATLHALYVCSLVHQRDNTQSTLRKNRKAFFVPARIQFGRGCGGVSVKQAESATKHQQVHDKQYPGPAQCCNWAHPPRLGDRRRTSILTLHHTLEVRCEADRSHHQTWTPVYVLYTAAVVRCVACISCRFMRRVASITCRFIHMANSAMGPVNLCFGHAHIFGSLFCLSCESTTPPCTRTFAAPEGCCYVRTLQVAGRLCLPTPTHASRLFSISPSAFVPCPGASVAHIRSQHFKQKKISDLYPPSPARPVRPHGAPIRARVLGAPGQGEGQTKNREVSYTCPRWFIFRVYVVGSTLLR